MKKRLTIFAAATAAALMLAACSGGSGSGAGSPGGGAAGGAGSPGAGEAVSSQDADAEGTGAQTGSPAGGPDGAAAREVELMFWYWADNTEQSDLIQGIVEDFNRDNGRGDYGKGRGISLERRGLQRGYLYGCHGRRWPGCVHLQAVGRENVRCQPAAGRHVILCGKLGQGGPDQ